MIKVISVSDQSKGGKAGSEILQPQCLSVFRVVNLEGLAIPYPFRMEEPIKDPMGADASMIRPHRGLPVYHWWCQDENFINNHVVPGQVQDAGSLVFSATLCNIPGAGE